MSRVPDAVQRAPGDAKHRPVRCSAEPGPMPVGWTPDQQRTASRCAASGDRVAERVLGLPGDIRVDKDVPFNKIPTKGRA